MFYLLLKWNMYSNCLLFQSSCSSASPSFIFDDFVSSEVDRVLDKVVDDLISEATNIVASEI